MLRFASTLFCLLLCAVIPAAPAAANPVIVVDSAADTPDPDPFDGICGPPCTIVAAIDTANALGLGFLIQITVGTIPLSQALTITSDVTIAGFSGPGVIQMTGGERAIEVAPGVTAALKGLTIQGGSATTGACIHVDAANLTVIDVHLSSCNAADRGGALHATNGATVNVQGGSAQNNTANFGAAYAVDQNASLSVTDSTVTLNVASFEGGAFYVDNGWLVVNGTMVDSNQALFGAGASLHGATATLGNSTFSRNTAGSSAGGLAASNSTVNGTNVTISANDGGFGVGGCEIGGGVGGVWQHVTVVFNLGGFVPDCFVDGSNLVSFDHTAIGFLTLFGGIGSLGFNYYGVLDNVAGVTLLPTDSAGDSQSPLDLVIEALADNGGQVETNALGPGSPLYEGGSSQPGPADDARGVPRPQEGAREPGAVETTECHNHVDDDDVDTDVDAQDPDCVRRSDTSERPHNCDDGKDNDGDELVDEADPDCADGQSGEKNVNDSSGEDCGGRQMGIVTLVMPGAYAAELLRRRRRRRSS